MAMRADSALSHLYDNEICIVTMKDGSTRKLRWSKTDWRFYDIDTPVPSVCEFDDIREWRPASIIV
jgi:hypothetical protein